eukprot:SAG11_NODE_237_length_11835_cov_11.023347_10_plen_41_part_00
MEHGREQLRQTDAWIVDRILGKRDEAAEGALLVFGLPPAG